MAISLERLRVLKLIQEGKITAEEGVELLELLDLQASGQAEKGKPETAASGGGGRGARWLCVRVTDTNSGKTRVNVRMPISVVKTGLKMGARFSPEVEGLDTNQLMDFIRSGETGKIVDLYDEVDGEHTEVFLE
ncbi:MAG: hypothetical protein HPY59_04425 [Anaerolineae bacterium]|nr:hypothetical protein [Anaerolineae bacterium]